MFQKSFGNVNGIDKQLLNENNKTYPAELALFAVSSSCRGKGIGKMLFQSALNYMKQEKLKEFYLFTDTSCNYGFYEHQGMKRTLEKKHVFNIKGQQAVMNFFIYDYQLSNWVKNWKGAFSYGTKKDQNETNYTKKSVIW